MIEDEIQTSLEKYVEMYEAICHRVNDNQIIGVIVQEVAKDARMEQRRNEQNDNHSDFATEKQLGYLKKLRIPIDGDLTKAQASALIDKAVAEQAM